MSEIIDSSHEQKTKSTEEEKIDDNEWLNSSLESDVEKSTLNAEEVVKREKTWMETLRGRAKEIATILALVTAFSAGEAAAKEIQAFAGHDSDNDNMEETQKSRSELLQILESKNQEFLNSLPEGLKDLQIVARNDDATNGEIKAALADENIFVAKHYYGFDYMDPQFTGNVLNVERKSSEAVALGHAENVEADGEIFTIDGYGATKEEALAKALEIAAEYIGTNVVLNSEKSTEFRPTRSSEMADGIVSRSKESERTAAHYIKSYKEIGSSEEERPGGEKFYNVQIEVQPGKIAQQ